ncbi:MAG: N-terminal phage integrase SAM-like domain-containing protein [Candidatus Dormibacteria bacterium]
MTAAVAALTDHWPLAPERQTLGESLGRWPDTTVRPSVRPSTHETYAGVVRHHHLPDLGRVRLSRLTPQDVQEMLNRWGLVGRNVAGLARSPKKVRYEIHSHGAPS